MSRKPRVCFVPCDDNNLPHLERLINSLRKFHSEEELPLIKYDLKEIPDPNKWYYATPMVGRELLNEYEVVLKLDCDQIITGDISAAWELDDFDIAVVQNSNPREYANYPVSVLDINPLEYVNCGFVAMKNQAMVTHWFNLCQSYHFTNYQYREQDLLNILVHYGDYKVKWLDASEKWYGLVSKGYWPQIVLGETGQLLLQKNEEWPVDSDKQIVCLHWAGGNDPTKGNYNIRFKPEVVKRLDELIKP